MRKSEEQDCVKNVKAVSDMACKESICRNCFHSYVCEQFNENKDDNNKKCHFANDHYIPRADVVPKSEVEELKAIIADHKASEERWQELYADTVDKWEKAYEELEIKLENAKADVAREIFEEIERTCVDTFGNFYIGATRGPFAELKKKYTESENG